MQYLWKDHFSEHSGKENMVCYAVRVSLDEVLLAVEQINHISRIVNSHTVSILDDWPHY